jgi:uncharacterized caspase-like protein
MNFPVRLLTALFVAVSAIGVGADLSFADTRVALVIGNGAYQNAPRLPNPRNDATDVAAALRRSGFDTVLSTDLDKAGMDEATIRFARAARTADVAMFYYSGHALQFGGANYLVPIDAKLADEADLRRMTRVDDVVADLAQAKNFRILVLDACRDNPLADQLRRSIGATRAIPLQRGLAKIDSPEGMIVAYATQAGRTAEDGGGRNSPYTTAFLKHIDEKEEIGSIFRRVSADVYKTTKHEQLPELSLSFIGEFYLHGKVMVKPEDAVRRDFEAAEGVNTVTGWDAFLQQYSNGFFATLARERRTQVAAADAQTKLTIYNLTALSDARTSVRTYYNLTPDCNQNGTVTVRVLKQPSQGTLEIARDRGFTNYAADNIRAKCNAQEVELTRVWYKSNADFKGRDQAQLEAFFSTGTSKRTTLQITVK